MSSAAASISIRTIDDVTVVEVLESTLSDAVLLDHIGERLRRLVREEGARKLVIDLSRVEYMSSSGLGILLEVHNTVKPRPLHVFGVNEPIRKILEVSKLDTMLRISADLDAALELLRD